MGGHRFAGAGHQSAGTGQHRGSAFTVAGSRDTDGVAFAIAATTSAAAKENTCRTKIRTQAQDYRQTTRLACTPGAENRGAGNGSSTCAKRSKRGAPASGTSACCGSRNAICPARFGQNQCLCFRRICGKQSQAGLSRDVQAVWRRGNGDSASARESRRHGRASGNTIIQWLSAIG